jgi:hypothetical protein
MDAERLAHERAMDEAAGLVRPLPSIVETFRRWLHLPDPTPLYAVLGTVAANRLEGDAVWLLLVGPPGGGKSELLGALTALPDVHPAATLTEAALLSGAPKREHAADAKGGLLRAIGDFGIVVCKDFGSVLSMNRDARAAVLAALREVYDGSWTRHVGTDGGRTLSWSGKVGLIGGCTPTIDRHHAVMGAMGERFLLLRLPDVEPDAQAREALAHAGHERTMRSQLAQAVLGLLGGTLPREPRARSDEETERLVALSTLVVRARSAVERDGHTREIELVPGAEAPTRLAITLDRLLAGLDAIGLERERAWHVVARVALDSVPALRLALLRALEGRERADTNELAGAVRHPASTTRRALEDLVAHGLVEQHRAPKGEAHEWSVSAFARARLGAIWLNHALSRNVVEYAERERRGVLTFRERFPTAENGPPPAPGEPGFEDFIRRAYVNRHLTERERDARLALHRTYRRLAAVREAGRSPTDAERAELAAALELARGAA